MKIVLPNSDSAYDKYFKGTRNLKELWRLIVEYFDEPEFCKNLLKTLKDSGTAIVANRFGV